MLPTRNQSEKMNDFCELSVVRESWICPQYSTMVDSSRKNTQIPEGIIGDEHMGR